MLLGAIADDLTGATDLALMLSKEGMRTVLQVGHVTDMADADAVVVALKSRTIPSADAVRQSLTAARALLAAGAGQLYFKYCSTFDSTQAGNIGPVAAALRDLVGAPIAIACPALPVNGRTVYRGHLFVGDQLLSDSPMKHHPLTPMTDANLVRVLGAQTDIPVGLVGHRVVATGPDAVSQALDGLARDGHGFAIMDAISDDDLRTIARAVSSMPLVTGGSGLAIGLPQAFREAGRLVPARQHDHAPPAGRGLVLAGSCSAATRRQVAAALEAGLPTLRLDPAALAERRLSVEQVLSWIMAQDPTLVPVVYSSAAPEEVTATQQRLGREAAGELIEEFLSQVAVAAFDQGFTRIVVAGGETSGAVVNALGVHTLTIGPEIAPGVPWTTGSKAGRPIALALKSGNFGDDRFFMTAWEQPL